jgi:hypothetical protein
VYNYNGKVSLCDGVISGTNANVGGGVYNHYGGSFIAPSFIMSGGTLSGNTAEDKGGGVYNYYLSVFSLCGGVISNNTAPLGSGVCNDGTFSRQGGVISYNTVYSNK